ncbi:unnamed protein product, partial [marine sediment metagenome]
MPWRVYWFGDADPETGRQQKYVKSFRHSREAREFQTNKQADLNRGEARDRPEDVMLGRLLDEFWEARVANLSYVSREGYKNTMEQLRECFGEARPLSRIDRRHAETFMATRKRRDGRSGDLSSWSRARHLMHCRAIFGAAVEWGYLAQNPYAPSKSRGGSPLRIQPKSRPWQHIIPDEFAWFLAEVPTARRRAAYWLMYGCGLRAGEVYNLTIDKIDLENRKVFIENREATDDVPSFTVKGDRQSHESKERTVPIPGAAIHDLTEAVKGAFKAGGFVALTPERYAAVRRNWGLCRAGRGWAGHSHRPWQNRDMMNNVLRDTKRYMRMARIDVTAPLTLHTFR